MNYLSDISSCIILFNLKITKIKSKIFSKISKKLSFLIHNSYSIYLNFKFKFTYEFREIFKNPRVKIN